MDRFVAEAALAHTVGVVEGAYLRSDLFLRRREVMQGGATTYDGEGLLIASKPVGTL